MDKREQDLRTAAEAAEAVVDAAEQRARRDDATSADDAALDAAKDAASAAWDALTRYQMRDWDED